MHGSGLYVWSAVPSAPPRNLTFDLLERHLSLRWAELHEEELQGKLQAYKLQWILGGELQVISLQVLIQ